MKILKLIKDFFLPPKNETYLVRPPKDVTKSMQKDYYSKQLQKQNTAQQVEILKLRQKVLRQKQDKQEEKELREIEIQILKTKEQEKILEKSTSLFLPFKGVRRLPTIYTKSNKPLGKGAGFFTKTTKDGVVLWYLAVKIRRTIKRINVYSQNPIRFFKNPLNWALQIKTGKLDTNIDFTGDGKAVLIEDKDVFEKFIEKQSGEKTKVMMMDEIERHDYETKLSGLREQLKTYLSVIQRQKEREIDYENKINELEMNVAYTKKDRNINAAYASNLKEKQSVTTEALAKSFASEQDLKVNSVIAERLSAKLLDSVDLLQDKLEKYIPEDKLGLARAEVEGILLSGIEVAKTAQTPTKLTITSQKDEMKKVEQEENKRQKKGGLFRR